MAIYTKPEDMALHVRIQPKGLVEVARLVWLAWVHPDKVAIHARVGTKWFKDNCRPVGKTA
jgi:hypothetical protein